MSLYRFKRFKRKKPKYSMSRSAIIDRQGSAQLSDWYVRRHLSRGTKVPPSMRKQLSDIQLQILTLLTLGKSDKEIADEMDALCACSNSLIELTRLQMQVVEMEAKIAKLGGKMPELPWTKPVKAKS